MCRVQLGESGWCQGLCARVHVHTHICAHTLATLNTVPQFTAGEPKFGHKQSNWNNPRCGSIFTAKLGNRSLYGYIEKFIQVRCHFRRDNFRDLAMVTWFPQPTYPDGDPLTVDINLRGVPPAAPKLLRLDEIDPARILYLVSSNRTRMCPMRIEGLDISPDLE